MDKDLENEIVCELRRVRAPAKVSRKLGIDIRVVLEVADKSGGSSRVSHIEQFGGQGRPEMRKYVVGAKRAHEAWDNSDPTIAQARSDFEAGTHEMVTGRDGDWLLLYAIPRNKVLPRPNYFQSQG